MPVRKAVSRLKPAGPPPIQTMSKMSGVFVVIVAYLLLLNVLMHEEHI